MKIKTTILTLVASIAFASTFTTSVSATTNDEQSEFLEAYNEGRQKGILNDENMTKKDFFDLCKKSVFPAYLNYVKDNPTTSFSQYIAYNNYEVPVQQPDDHPTIVRANNSDNSNFSFPFVNLIAAHNGYNMKAGNILICYGTDSMGKYVGHAAIATSANYILEMPGTAHRSAIHNARHVSKEFFFKTYANGAEKYVAVYRMKDHPIIADHASTYAYNYMYKTSNPTYSIAAQALNTYVKSPSYCSKYVYYAYYREKQDSVFMMGSPTLIFPHDLMNKFMPTYHVSYIHKITSY